jgi:RimJ/RimL family protein N-acetyltransferase
MHYKVLPKSERISGNFEIRVLRKQDIYEIMEWRNEQIQFLRQSTKLTKEDQKKYYESIIEPSFSCNKPDLILFSFLKEGKLVGYGGLVHINWTDRTAEISFLIKTSLSEKYFSKFWNIFLNLIETVAFEELYLDKLFTYSYNIRPQLYPILESNGYSREARLKMQHQIYGFGYVDGIYHSKFSKRLFNLREANINDMDLLYSWRNENSAKTNSFSNNEFSIESHKKWYQEKLNSPRTKLFILEFNQTPTGQIRVEDVEGYSIINYSIAETYQGRGFGETIIDHLLKMNVIKTNFVIAEVKHSNTKSISIFLKKRFLIKKVSEEKITFIKQVKNAD